MPNEQIQQNEIRSIEDFVSTVKRDCEGWCCAWFRGEPTKVDYPLLPKLYRLKSDGTKHNENQLLQLFRMKAPIFGGNTLPENCGAIDQWLFLAQHVGLPTRLLDWTESALVALYFALQDEKPVVWMLDPIKLNALSGKNIPEGEGQFPLTWRVPQENPLLFLEAILDAVDVPKRPKIDRMRYRSKHINAIKRELRRTNFGAENICGAWENDARGNQLPVAVLPTNIHQRMSVQRSCFTVWGKDKKSLSLQLQDRKETILHRYVIFPPNIQTMLNDLRLLGISHSTIFPDLDGLAKELSMVY